MKKNRPFLLATAGFLAAAATSHSQILLGDFALNGTQETSVWTNLKAGTGTNLGGSPTNWGFSPGSGNGTLVAGDDGFGATAGLYAYGGANSYYTATVGDTGDSITDITTVLLQFTLSPNTGSGWPSVTELGYGPQLTYTHAGGTGTIAAADFLGISALQSSGTVMGDQTFENWVFQWDLSGLGVAVTAVSIYTPIPLHSSTTGARLDIASGSNPSQIFTAVPEPTAVFLTLGALAATMGRRIRC